ncbi:MFS transporter [Ammoniphilus sp. YIM 78166]|uniref:MFS transporter n=1 Tax=Ammoniphilus sp. YIM 78166 TaxID=1644106 RepID=UPI001070317C|nr:MFS transporter [Ammoniphilus sp. YIM 78166]
MREDEIMNRIMTDRRFYPLLIANLFSSVGSGITMITIPWILVNRQGGEQLFGYAALGMTLVLFFVSPYIGTLIDRFSRKSMLLFSEVFGFVLIAGLTLWGYLAGHYDTWQLIAIYVTGSLYYSVHFPTQFAFTQEIFDRSQYQALNSVMEIQNQTASMIAGGLASMLINKVDLVYLLSLDALTYLVGYGLISSIPYQHSLGHHANAKTTIWSNMKEGFLYMKDKPLFILFFACSLMPFIGVMIGNYLYPVYVSKVLQADASVMGLSDMSYAIGAILAGFTIPWLITKLGSYRSVSLTVATFALATILTAWIPIVGLFLLLKIALGWGNAGSRVARNTILMQTVPNALIGRVNSFFNALGMGLRVGLLGLFSQTVSYSGASTSLSMMGLLLIGAFAGVLFSRSLFTVQTDVRQSTV